MSHPGAYGRDRLRVRWVTPRAVRFARGGSIRRCDHDARAEVATGSRGGVVAAEPTVELAAMHAQLGRARGNRRGEPHDHAEGALGPHAERRQLLLVAVVR